MSKKDQCKELMFKFFGPASATQVEVMTEDNCIELCRKKVAGFIGEDAAQEFDNI